MKNWFKSLAIIASCAFVFGMTGVASADEYEGYDEDGTYYYATTDEEGNVAVAAMDEDGNYAVYAEDAEGNSYEEEGSF